MKASCHPYAPKIQGTMMGATIAPMLAPELKIPVASARSLLGNHSATVLIAAGKFPASPAPKAARAAPNPNEVFAKACAIAANDQMTMEMA